MEVLALLFGLVLTAAMLLVALGLILACLQGIVLAFRADTALGVIAVVLVFPCTVFGLLYWITGNDWPAQFMDKIQPQQDQPDDNKRNPDHQDDPDGGVGAAGGDNHDSADHDGSSPAGAPGSDPPATS